MKTSTIIWILTALIIVIGIGAYTYTAPAGTPVAQTEVPNPNGSNLPVGDMAPVPSTPIASSSAHVGASTTSKQ